MIVLVTADSKVFPPVFLSASILSAVHFKSLIIISLHPKNSVARRS